MLLVIDVGNTNITTALVRDGSIGADRRAPSRPAPGTDELEATLAELLRLDDATPADVDAITACSVVPSIAGALDAVARRHDWLLVFATPDTIPIPVRNGRREEVGADRLVNAFAAGRLHGAPAVVVDLGTATTFDCVAADGAFVGGAISPGLALGLDALAARTALLPRVEIRAPARAIGRDTVSAIESGWVLGHQELVSGLLDRIRDELADDEGVEPTAVRTVLTGGLSRASWTSGIRGIDVVDPLLTLRGLAILQAEAAARAPLGAGLA